jgi:hypothetical protein
MSNLTVPGVDYAWANKNYDALKAAGVKFVMRYISHDASKDLTLGEKRELHRRGIKVGVVFEARANRALGGHSAGVSDATYSEARVKALGLPGIPVYFGVDWDVTDAQKPAVADYLAGAASVIGKSRTGVYGGYWVVKYMVEHGVCSWFWQTYAWSGGHIHPEAHIHQFKNGDTIGGMSVDRNHGSTAGFGARGPGAVDDVAASEELKRWKEFATVLDRICTAHPEMRTKSLASVRSYYRERVAA